MNALQQLVAAHRLVTPFEDRRSAPPRLPETCYAPTAAHDGQDVRTYVLVRADRRSLTRLCRGCVTVASSVGLVYEDPRR